VFLSSTRRGRALRGVPRGFRRAFGRCRGERGRLVEREPRRPERRLRPDPLVPRLRRRDHRRLLHLPGTRGRRRKRRLGLAPRRPPAVAWTRAWRSTALAQPRSFASARAGSRSPERRRRQHDRCPASLREGGHEPCCGLHDLVEEDRRGSARKSTAERGYS
jgi:hypothetical protein